jgi:hypothetical protein
MDYFELLRASESTIAPTYLHWPCVVGYGPFSLFLTHKEGLCPSSGDIADDDDEEVDSITESKIQFLK